MSISSLAPGLLLLVPLVLAGCTGDDSATVVAPEAPQAPAPAMATFPRAGADAAVIERVADMYNTGMNGGGWAIADEIYAPDYVPHVPGFPQMKDLPSAIAELNAESMTLSDYHFVLDDVFGAGDEIVARFTATAKWIWQVPEARPYVNPGIIIFRFENGKIAEEWWQFDLLGVQEQVGFVPPTPTRSGYGWSPSSTVTGNPGIPGQNASLVRRAAQMVSTGNLVLAEHVLSPTLLYHDPAVPPVTDLTSFEQVVVAPLRTAFPDVHVAVEDVVASGDRVAVRLTFQGTQLQPFGGIPTTGRTVEWTSSAIYRIADRKIVEAWSAWDAAGLLTQLMAP
ncbi:MAG: ester cyclase [Gemmatimonadetes bacterium]|nr:ester cyclase [Gemmatimonadota bacterium]